MRITYTSDLGRSIVFALVSGLKETPYFLTDAAGIHGLVIEPFLQTTYGQDGATLVGALLDPREFTLGGKIIRDVVANRIHMLQVMNPKTSGTLLVERTGFARALRCQIIQAPSFPTKRGDTFTIIFVAPNPYWRQATATRTDIATTIPLFEWPLDIPAEGISFGERTVSQVVSVTNDGEATVGMQVDFTAWGSGVVNPRITNVATGGMMRVVTTLNAGDVVTLRTGYGEKQVLIQRTGGVAENAWPMLDKSDLTFLLLAPGENVFRYDADTGVELMDVTLHYYPGYLGV